MQSPNNPKGLCGVQAWWDCHITMRCEPSVSQGHLGLPTYLHRSLCFESLDVDVIFNGLVLTVHVKATAGCLLNTYTFLPALSLAYAYTFAQDNPTRSVQFFIINFEAKYLPFAMLFLTFVTDGPDAAATQLPGLIAAHLYDFLTRIWPTFGGGTNYIRTPQIVKNWFTPTPGGIQNRGYGHVVDGRGRTAGAPGSGAQPSTGRTTGANTSWSGMGPGRRLGG